MSSTLYLFRHGQIATQGTLAGQNEYPLSEIGRAQAEAWGQSLAHLQFSAAWCSPLGRAHETTQIILASGKHSVQKATPVEALKEIALGLWEGKSKKWVQKQYPREWEKRGLDIVHTAPPGGESIQELADRVIPAFMALCVSAGQHVNSILVTHQAVNRVILAYLLALPLSCVLEIPQPYGAMVRLSLPLEI